MKQKIKKILQKRATWLRIPKRHKTLGESIVPRTEKAERGIRATTVRGEAGSHNIASHIAWFGIGPVLVRQMQKTWRWVMATPMRRIGAVILVSVAIWGAVVLPISGYLLDQHYLLNESTRKIVGNVNPSIADKIVYDSQDQAYYLNRDGISIDVTNIEPNAEPGEVAKQLQRQKIGGGNIKKAEDLLYSAKVSVNPKEGVTFYENNLNISFSITPKMKLMGGRLVDGHLVFPQSKESQLIYSAKGNGLKEDIVLQSAPDQELHIAYDLSLAQTLAARVLDDGSVGIYSADPAFFGKNMNFSSDQEREVIMNARKNSEKTHLVFVIPAPIIVSARGSIGQATAKFVLSKDQKLLTVQTTGLETAAYPLSIDPSMVITTTSDFTSKLSSADNIDFSVADQIKRAGLTGGSTGTWTSSANNFSTGRFGHSSVAYNGYLYVMGGNNMGSYLNDTQYTALNASDGSLGTWTNSANTFTTPRLGLASVAYNGCLYILGGTGASGNLADVQYTRINSNGSLNTWASTTSLPAARYYHAAVAYNGFMYVIGGDTGTRQNDVLYMPILANGSLSTSWTTTTSFTTARRLHTAVAYNSYLYILGGDNGSPMNDVQYAPINANGTVGTWVAATNTFTTARNSHTSVVYNGYIYVMCGLNGADLNDVQYAPLNTNGSPGKWATNNNNALARDGQAAATYNGYIYLLGGSNAGVYNTTSYAKVDPASAVSKWTATTSYSGARQNAMFTIYNGYAYLIGGLNGSPQADIQYAPVNSNGTLGTWTTLTATPLPAGRSHAAAIAYNGFLYVLGGYNASYVGQNTVYYAPINANGTLGTWQSGTTLSTPRSSHTAVTYRGYIYAVGGSDGGGNYVNSVEYATISPLGIVGTWASVSTFTTARGGHASVVINGYLYILGGMTTGAVRLNNMQYAPLNTNGTIGTWTSSTIPMNAQNPTAVAYNGYIYLMGGFDGTTYYNTTYRAVANTNGSLGAWTQTSAFTNTRQGAGSAVWDGVIYIAGGINPTIFTDVQYARVGNGGDGTAQGWTTSGNSFTTGRYSHAALTYNGYLYVLGGYISGGDTNDVQYAQINANGAIGTFANANTTTSFTSRNTFSAVAYRGYMYVLGGLDSSAGMSVGSVQYSPIAANGQLGTWNTTNAPIWNVNMTGYFNTAVVAYNGYMYRVAGTDRDYGVSVSNQFSSAVYYTVINADGTLASWNTTTALPDARSEHCSIVYNGYIYALGGYKATTTFDPKFGNTTTYDYSNVVYYAQLNSGNGTVGTWSTTSSFHIPRDSFECEAYNGYIYILDGRDSNKSAYYNDVQYAAINGNGTLGEWRHTASTLNNGRLRAKSIMYNGFIYQTGGYYYNGTSTYYNDVQYSQVSSLPRVSSFFKDLSISPSSAIESITYNGTVTNGTSAISYSTASSAGLFGSLNKSSVLPNATPTLCKGTSASGVYYVRLQLRLDDTVAATYPDTLMASFNNVTDMTINYDTLTPDPIRRLRGGKYFATDAQSQQPLDTCRL